MSDGFLLKREPSAALNGKNEQHTQKDLYIQLIDYSNVVQSLLPDLAPTHAGECSAQLPKVAEPTAKYDKQSVSYNETNIYKALQHKALIREEMHANFKENARPLSAAHETKSQSLPADLPQEVRALFLSEFEQTDEPNIDSAGWLPKGLEKTSF